jgi:hypothetical protein
VLQALAVALLETAETWAQIGWADGEVREIIGAVDATFLARMMLIGLDLRTGSLLLAEVAADRPYATWQALVEERLTALRSGVRSLVSDRAKALIQLADKGLECLRRPDVLPCMHDRVQSYALPMIRRVRQAHQELQKAEAGLSKPPGLDGQGQGAIQAALHVAGLRAAAPRWEAVHSTSRDHLEALSLTLPPFHLHASTPPTSAQVQSRWQAEIAGIEA